MFHTGFARKQGVARVGRFWQEIKHEKFDELLRQDVPISMNGSGVLNLEMETDVKNKTGLSRLDEPRFPTSYNISKLLYCMIHTKSHSTDYKYMCVNCKGIPFNIFCQIED